MLISDQINWPKPNSSLESHEFQGDACLYRDHLGRRVVADWEGRSSSKVLRASCTIQQFGLSNGGEMFPQAHANWGTMVADGPGDVSVLIKTEMEPVQFENAEFGEHFSGCGYVEGKDEEVEIDGSHVRRKIPSGEFAPFFQRFDANSVHRAFLNPRVVWQRVADFSVVDAVNGSVSGFSVQNLSAPVVLRSLFSDGSEREAEVAYQLNEMEFTVLVPPGCQGIRIGKLYDRFHGRQCARVRIEGELAGLWLAVCEDRLYRWAWSWFGASLEPKDSERTVQIRLDPMGGTPLWSLSRLSVLCQIAR